MSRNIVVEVFNSAAFLRKKVIISSESSSSSNFLKDIKSVTNDKVINSQEKDNEDTGEEPDGDEMTHVN